MKIENLKVLMIDSLVGNDYSLFLCNELAKQKVDVSLVMTVDRKISFETFFNVIKIMPSKNPDISRFKKTLIFPLYFFKLIKLIYRQNFRIVHYQFFRLKTIESFFYILLKFFRVKLIHTVHEVLPIEKGNNEIYFDKLIYKFSDALIVHSKRNMNDLSINYKIAHDKLYVTPHGSFNFYEGTSKLSIESARKELKIDINKKVILFFGAIKKYKGVDSLLNALQNYTENDLTLIIAGEIESKEIETDLLERIKKVPLNVTIITIFEFIEHSKIPIYFTASDIIILPYKKLTHSGVLHLAYSFSKPVIATKVGDFEESIENFKSGLLVNPNDDLELLNAIKKMTSGELDLKSMGDYAKNLMKKNTPGKRALVI